MARLVASAAAVLVASVPHQGADQSWQLVVSISVIVGIAAALVTFAQLAIWIRNRRVEERVLDLVRDQLTAEDIKGRVKDLIELNQKLEDQIDRIPSEANHLFLQNRMATLASSIASDYEEYRSLETAIGASRPETGLDPMIRGAIEHAILPAQKRRDRLNRHVLVLLGLLVVLSLSPISISGLIYQYFGVLGDPEYPSGDSVIAAVVLGTIIIAASLLILAGLWAPLLRALDRLQGLGWLVALVTATVMVSIGGYWVRLNLIYMECSPNPCSFAASTLAPPVITLNLVPVLSGLLLAALARRIWRLRPAYRSLGSTGRAHDRHDRVPDAP